MKQYAYIYRDEKKMLSIQISFPVDENNVQQVNIPEALKELDKNVKINGR